MVYFFRVVFILFVKVLYLLVKVVFLFMVVSILVVLWSEDMVKKLDGIRYCNVVVLFEGWKVEIISLIGFIGLFSLLLVIVLRVCFVLCWNLYGFILFLCCCFLKVCNMLVIVCIYFLLKILVFFVVF